MATIKSFTDIEQSKKLAEILPLESADFMWEYEPDKETYWDKPTMIPIDSYIFVNDIPCWSLAALLENLPIIDGYGEEKPYIGKFGNKYICRYEGEEDYGQWRVADNPVDACYEMILKLHELNLL